MASLALDVNTPWHEHQHQHQQVDEERRNRVYALNSEWKDSVAPDVVMMAVSPRPPPSSQPNGESAAVGGNGHADEDAAGGNAGGETLAVAPAPADAASRNASAEQAQDEQNGGCDFCSAAVCVGTGATRSFARNAYKGESSSSSEVM